MENKIIIGDCLEVMRDIKDESIDFILTDPPYFIQEEVSIIRRSNEMKYKGKDINFLKGTEWDRVWNSREEYLSWLEKVIKEFARILKENRHCVIFVDKRNLSYVWDMGEKYGFKGRTPFFLIYTNPVPQARRISPCKSVQVAVWLTKGKPKTEYYNWQLGMHKDTIYTAIPTKEGASVRHPTQKPLFAGLYLTALLSKPNDLCLDPFAGSLTFPIAFKLLGRKYIGIEINEQYVDLKRFNNPKVREIFDKFISFMWNVFKETGRDRKLFNELLNVQNLGL